MGVIAYSVYRNTWQPGEKEKILVDLPKLVEIFKETGQVTENNYEQLIFQTSLIFTIGSNVVANPIKLSSNPRTIFQHFILQT